MEKVNDRILKMRNVWRLSEAEVAKNTGIDLKTYKKYENGEIEPTTKDAIALGSLFKVSLDYLFTGKASKEDMQSINRPLTREEKNSDKWVELEKTLPKKLAQSYKKVLWSIFIERDSKLFDNSGHLSFNKILSLDNFDLLEEVAKRGMFDLHYVIGTSEHIASKSIDDVLTFKKVFDYLMNNNVKDQKFVDYAIKLNPVAMLNYYFLQPGKRIDKKQTLKCLNSGGYIEKIVEVRYYTDYTNDWDDGEPAAEYKKGQDVFATQLLREYCEK